MSNGDTYRAEDWPYGLRCMDCNELFVEGQAISKRLVSMDEFDGEPLVHLDIVCVPCNLGVAAR